MVLACKEQQRERREQEDRADVKIADGAKLLIEKFGADDFVAFAGLYRSSITEVVDRAIHLAAAARARDIKPVDVPVNEIERSGHTSHRRWLSPEDQQIVDGFVERINAGGEIDPILVMEDDHSAQGARHYVVVDGALAFRAYVDKLERDTIPVRIAPAPPTQALDQAVVAVEQRAVNLTPEALREPRRRYERAFGIPT